MKVLITGITGFVGSHLAEYILEHHPDVEIFGIKRWRSNMANIQDIESSISFYECDIKDAHNVSSIIETIKPDKIFHLAAQSFVPTSWESPSETLEINITGQCNVFEAVRKLISDDYNPVIQIACSSEEYGLVKPDEIPIRESNPLRPMSPYAVSKVAQDYMGYQYYMSYGVRIIRTRTFNHSGPRRGDVFVDSNFAKQVAEIERGRKEPVIQVGNLDARRDFTDVRDIVKAYWIATEKCEPGEVYNICSGQDYKIKDVLQALINHSNHKGIKVIQDPKRMRPSDVPVLLGDNSKFCDTTGWKPEIDYMNTTLVDTLNYWREQIK